MRPVPFDNLQWNEINVINYSRSFGFRRDS